MANYYVIQGFFDNDWHDLLVYGEGEREKAYHTLHLETNYPKRIVEKTGKEVNNMAMLNRLLSMIKCSKKRLGTSSDLYHAGKSIIRTTGDAYRVTLTYKGNRCSFVFHDNFNNESTKKDFIYCLVLDAQAYDSTRDFYDFATEFGYGYTRDSEARKTYRACEKQSERLHRLFNQQEIDILSEIE